MVLVSVNVGPSRPLGNRRSGIDKRPVQGEVQVGPEGLQGDVQVNKKHHGGPDQALYAYHLEDYEWWSTELGQDLSPGLFGENLTCKGLPEIMVGDRYRIGQVLMEVTAPRIPCNTLATRMGDPTFVKTFTQARRPGFYSEQIS